jgi:hypothetical protein
MDTQNAEKKKKKSLITMTGWRAGSSMMEYNWSFFFNRARLFFLFFFFFLVCIYMMALRV